MTDHLDRLRAMVEPDQATWDLSPEDVKAIKWAVAQITSLKYTLEQVGFQRDEHREAIDNLKVIRDATLARWERSFQELIDMADRMKRKVSQERAEIRS